MLLGVGQDEMAQQLDGDIAVLGAEAERGIFGVAKAAFLRLGCQDVAFRGVKLRKPSRGGAIAEHDAAFPLTERAEGFIMITVDPAHVFALALPKLFIAVFAEECKAPKDRTASQAGNCGVEKCQLVMETRILQFAKGTRRLGKALGIVEESQVRRGIGDEPLAGVPGNLETDLRQGNLGQGFKILEQSVGEGKGAVDAQNKVCIGFVILKAQGCQELGQGVENLERERAAIAVGKILQDGGFKAGIADVAQGEDREPRGGGRFWSRGRGFFPTAQNGAKEA